MTERFVLVVRDETVRFRTEADMLGN